MRRFDPELTTKTPLAEEMSSLNLKLMATPKDKHRVQKERTVFFDKAKGESD